MFQRYFSENLEQEFHKFRKCRMKLLFGDFNAKLWRANIFKPRNGNDSLQQDSNDNIDRIVNFET
jgi:hypothetical protein